jgi:ankyrin repeat protein
MQNMSIVDIQDEYGDTALYRAVEAGDELSVQQLLLKGASPNVPNKAGWNPLHVASANDDIRVVRRLIDARAQLDAKTHFG